MCNACVLSPVQLFATPRTIAPQAPLSTEFPRQDPLFATPWTVDYQAPLSMGFTRQECWSGMPLPSPDLGISWSKYLKTLLSSVKLLSGYQYHPNPRPRKIPVVPGLFAWSSHNSEVVGETPEKATATHSSTLAWKILGTEDSGRLQSMGSLRVGHD